MIVTQFCETRRIGPANKRVIARASLWPEFGWQSAIPYSLWRFHG
jgi:hypothetical protein